MEMKRSWLLFVALLTLVLTMSLLAGCGSQSAVADAPAAEGELSLADTVDVATVASIKDRDDVVVLDVREPYEYEAGHIPGVTLIPMNDVPQRLSEIPTDKTVIVTCRTGNRSSQVTDYLRQQGFDNVHNMAGGIVDWEAAGYDVER
jgi:phage shock protein E